MSPIDVPDGILTVGQRIGQIETAMVGISNRVDKIEGRIDRYDGRIDVIISLGRWLLGTSLIGTVMAVITFYLLVSGSNPK